MGIGANFNKLLGGQKFPQNTNYSSQRFGRVGQEFVVDVSDVRVVDL